MGIVLVILFLVGVIVVLFSVFPCLGPLPPAEQLEALQATCRQFARLIDFVLSFDALKMCTPALQNDFSFYRRAMSREVR